MGTSLAIDAHVHFWDPAVLHYPWLGQAPEFQRAFLPADLESLNAETLHGVVFVEANCRPSENFAEIAFVEALAEREPRIHGIVAFVDLCDAPGRRHSLEMMGGRAGVVGVRHNIQGQPRGFCLQPEFVRGVEEVGARGLAFDLCVTADQLLDAIELVRRTPGTSFVLDHCGKPAIRDEAFTAWAYALTRLAEHPNVACKLSGLLSEARPEQRTEDGLAKYAQHAMLCFGAERLMYGSDWPVATAAGGEQLWRRLVDTFISDWAPADRRAFFFDNAIRLYGLNVNAQR